MLEGILFRFLLAFIASGSVYAPQPARTPDPEISLTDFARLMDSLSEPEGYFDTDNLISNEASYLRILPALDRLNVRGGVYIGVGPDQNYSYIADTRPKLAIIVDIRRQNAIQHLYFKALFQLSANRVQYLERLFGRPISSRWVHPERERISEILRVLDLAGRNVGFAAGKKSEVRQLILSWNLGLQKGDLDAIDYVAQAFIDAGPDIKFTSYNRSQRPHHPTYRRLLQEKDPVGRQLSYLAREERFQTVKELHERNRILPVVGDFGGSHTFQSIGRELRRRGLQVKCFYASNVEFYLFRSERWETYVRNLRSLPLAEDPYVIRACANIWQYHPAQVAGYYMTTLMQSLRVFLENEASGKNETYWDLVTREYIIQ